MTVKKPRKNRERPAKQRGRTFRQSAPLTAHLGAASEDQVRAPRRYRRRPRETGSGSRGLVRVRAAMSGLTGSRLLSLMLVLAMTVLLAWFFLDPAFFVYQVQVHLAGSALIDAQSLLRATALDGMSIFYIDPSAVAGDIVRRIPNVSQAHVVVELPSRVSIRIAQKDVRFVWQSAGVDLLVDGEGWVLKPADGSHDQLLSIHDLDERVVRAGEQVDLAALKAVEELHRLLPEIKTFDYSQAKGVSLYDTRGWPIYFGDEQHLQEKVASLQAAMVEILGRGENPKFIDLRFVGSVYYE